jgi:hypothetical protein
MKYEILKIMAGIPKYPVFAEPAVKASMFLVGSL